MASSKRARPGKGQWPTCMSRYLGLSLATFEQGRYVPYELDCFGKGAVVRDGRWHLPLKFTLKNANLVSIQQRDKEHTQTEGERNKARGGLLWPQQSPTHSGTGREPAQAGGQVGKLGRNEVSQNC